MTFQRHPSCSSGLIQDFLDHYTLECKRQFLLTCKVSRYRTMHYAALQIQKAVSA